MFFKKSQEEFFHKLEEKMQSALRSFSAENKQMKEQLEEMGERIDRLQSALHKQDMAVGDLLDEWSESKDREEDVKKLIREKETEEKRFLDLFESYQEQFWNLKRFADQKDDVWASQITLMEKNLKQYQNQCGISMIEECGIKVDYDLHEVIEVTETSQAEMDKVIADIFRCGYFYKGRVKKKAQVMAYHFTGV